MPTGLPIGSIIAMTVLRKIDTGYVLSAYGEEVLLHHNETESALEVEQSAPSLFV